MHDSPRSDIGDLIAAIETGRAERLAANMVTRCWPGGPADRTDPAALEWVRRWSPKPVPGPSPDVSHN